MLIIKSTKGRSYVVRNWKDRHCGGSYKFCFLAFGEKNGPCGLFHRVAFDHLLALAFSHMEWGDAKQSVEYAKSVFVAIPVSLLFFVPFLLAQKFNFGFWSCYVSGIALLGVGYFIHTSVIKFL